MAAVVADTHVVVWYLTEPQRLSGHARSALLSAVQTGDPIYLASITLVELHYLIERQRVAERVLARVINRLASADADLVLVPLDLAITQAVGQIPRDAVPDMPDRVIGATALHLNLPLVTADRRLQSASIPTIW